MILHVDMDAFYASVEMARRPELRDRPMYVGGAQRGVVLSANYAARKHGIEGGMSSTKARRLCPQAVAVAPDFDTYQMVSKGVFSILDTITSQVEVASIDEAFLDVTGAVCRLGDPVLIGERLRAQVADEQQVPCSVGIGPSKFVAKLASKRAKPDGLLVVRPDEVVDFLHPLPLDLMWGVGEQTAGKLHQLGLVTIADLAHTPASTKTSVDARRAWRRKLNKAAAPSCFASRFGIRVLCDRSSNTKYAAMRRPPQSVEITAKL